MSLPLRFPDLRPGDSVRIRWAGTDLPSEVRQFRSRHENDSPFCYVTDSHDPRCTAYCILEGPVLNAEGKPFHFDPLKPAAGSAGELIVVCLVTKARAVWNDAARAGWVADLNGKAFAAYYSPEGRACAIAAPSPTLSTP